VPLLDVPANIAIGHARGTIRQLQIEESSEHERTDRQDRYDPGILEELGSSFRRCCEGQGLRHCRRRKEERGKKIRCAEKSGKEVRQKGSKKEVGQPLSPQNKKWMEQGSEWFFRWPHSCSIGVFSVADSFKRGKPNAL
jgi:hypothetical protein